MSTTIKFGTDGWRRIIAQDFTFDNVRACSQAVADTSWLLIRFSGTEPILRVYTESDSPVRVERLLETGRKLAGV